MYQMAQEGSLSPSILTRFGPHWHDSKLTRASVVNAALDVGSINIISLYVTGAIKNTLAWP